MHNRLHNTGPVLISISISFLITVIAITSGCASHREEIDVGHPLLGWSVVAFEQPYPSEELIIQKLENELGESSFANMTDNRWATIYESSDGNYHLVVNGSFDDSSQPVVRSITRHYGPSMLISE